METANTQKPGWFRDQIDRSWWVVFRDNGTAICNSVDGWFTAADKNTFRRWGWLRQEESIFA